MRAGKARICSRGGDGDDGLYTGSGNDRASGGRGDDRISFGGASGGDQTISGGEGADSFTTSYLMTSGVYRITDLQDGEFLWLQAIDANVNTSSNEAFILVDAFSGTAGEARLTYSAVSDTTTLGLDTDGDGAAEITILMSGDHRDHTGFML